MKTSELTGSALDWAVAKCEGMPPLVSGTMVVFFGENPKGLHEYTPSTDWSQGGPIIEREKIESYYSEPLEAWAAKHNGHLRYGSTPLVAAMRCYVASKLGDEVDIPEELL